VATYTGDEGNNIFDGTGDADQASGLGGDDILNGLGGADILQGGEGDDQLDGGDGDDFLYGGNQFADNFLNDDNILNGGAGTDFIYGGNGNDVMNGGADNDVLLDGKGGNNTADGGDGNDQIEFSGTIFGTQDYYTNIVFGGAGDDNLIFHESNGSMSGGTGNDRIRAERGTITIDGGADNDEITMGQAIFQTDGIQTATGGSGADLFRVSDASRFGARDRILDFNAAEGDRLTLNDVSNGRTGFFWGLSGASVAWRGALDPALFVLGAALPPGDFGTGFVGIWTTQTGGNTYVIADSNGDLVFDAIDMVVELAGSVAIDAASFSQGEVFGGTYGTAAADTLNGTSENDTIYGLGGDDVMNGGNGGFDALYGGDGNDTIDLTFSTRGSAKGGAGNDIITGSNGGQGDFIEGEAGDDVIEGLKGADQLSGGDGNDIIRGGDDGDFLDGGLGNDILEGGSGQNSLDGFHGDDILRGGEGEDHLFGNVGNDTVDYSLILTGAVTVRLTLGQQNTGAGGFDNIGAVENVTGTTGFGDTLEGDGGANILKGLGGSDTLTGLGGSDLLDGGLGADMMTGGADNDIYVVDDLGDQLFEDVSGGIDEVRTSLASYALAASFENLTGDQSSQTLTGNAGGNTLIGGGGADTLSGGQGNDIYIVSGSDLVLELAGEGADLVYTSVSYVLPSNQEIETLSTQSHAGTDDLFLTGNQYNNRLIGNAGDNLLNGVDGADVMYGLAGDDIYAIDNLGDLVIDLENQGNDLVLTYLSHTLTNGNQIETLSTVFHQGTDAINLGGNDYNNTLIGNYGANYLNGNGGADVMIGLNGNDTYVADNAGDAVQEAAGGGSDLLYSFVSYALAAGQEVEAISTAVQGGTAAINLTGNEFAQTIVGNAGANLLDGKGGSDVLYGLGGADTFAFTTALGAGNVDTLADFVAGADKIGLDDAIFTAIGASLNASAFVIGTAAGDADDRIVYNSATGALFYDADGNGAGAAVQFATLNPGLALAASDFTMI